MHCKKDDDDEMTHDLLDYDSDIVLSNYLKNRTKYNSI